MRNLLIVDDSKSVHAFIKSCFDAAGEFKLNHAYNGKEAVEKVKSGAAADLVLLDWEMPEMNGPQTMAEFNQIGMKTPVIMVTTKNAPADIKQMLVAGVQDYIMKPFTKDILIDKINDVLSR